MISMLADVTANCSPGKATPGLQAASGRLQSPDGVTVDSTFSRGLMDAVDNVFNLGERDTGKSEKKLTPKEQEQVLKIVAALLQNGYVGYEWLKVGSRIEKHDVTMEMGDSRLRDAKPYRDPVKRTSYRV